MKSTFHLPETLDRAVVRFAERGGAEVGLEEDAVLVGRGYFGGRAALGVGLGSPWLLGRLNGTLGVSLGAEVRLRDGRAISVRADSGFSVQAPFLFSPLAALLVLLPVSTE